MSKLPNEVVRRLPSGRYQLYLSQGQCHLLAEVLRDINQQPEPRASAKWPYFLPVLLRGAVRRLYRRLVVRLQDAGPRGLSLSLSDDELAAVGTVASIYSPYDDAYRLLAMLFNPIHQILS